MKLSLPQKKFLNTTSSVNAFISGVGSGKSHIAGVISKYHIQEQPFARGFIGANTHEQLTKSTLDRIFKVWRELGLVNGLDYVVDKIPPKDFKIIGQPLKSYHNTISFSNGALIFLSSLENYKAIDGTEFSWAILDETKDTREVAVKEVIIMRLRQKGFKLKGKEVNPLYILTSPAKVEWLNSFIGIENKEAEIKNKIFSKNDFYYEQIGNKEVVISSTYHNEHNLSDGYINNIKSNLANKEHEEMYIYGNPFSKSGGEWLPSFRKDKHVKEIDYNNSLPIHISLDFNVVPYMSLLVIQIDYKDGKRYVNVVDEYALENPKNTTFAICNEFLNDYRDCNYIYYYGDPSGKKRDTRLINHSNDYDILEDVLYSKIDSDSDKVIRSSDVVVNSRNFIENLLNERNNIILNISPKCVNLINDFLYLKNDANGSFEKKKVKTKNGVGEERGHLMDALRYFLMSAFSDEYNFGKKYL